MIIKVLDHLIFLILILKTSKATIDTDLWEQQAEKEPICNENMATRFQKELSDDRDGVSICEDRKVNSLALWDISNKVIKCLTPIIGQMDYQSNPFAKKLVEALPMREKKMYITTNVIKQTISNAYKYGDKDVLLKNIKSLENSTVRILGLKTYYEMMQKENDIYMKTTIFKLAEALKQEKKSDEVNSLIHKLPKVVKNIMFIDKVKILNGGSKGGYIYPARRPDALNSKIVYGNLTFQHFGSLSKIPYRSNWKFILSPEETVFRILNVNDESSIAPHDYGSNEDFYLSPHFHYDTGVPDNCRFLGYSSIIGKPVSYSNPQELNKELFKIVPINDLTVLIQNYNYQGFAYTSDKILEDIKIVCISQLWPSFSDTNYHWIISED